MTSLRLFGTQPDFPSGLAILVRDVLDLDGSYFTNPHPAIDRKHECQSVAVSVPCGLNDPKHASNIALGEHRCLWHRHDLSLKNIRNPNIKSAIAIHLPNFFFAVANEIKQLPTKD